MIETLHHSLIALALITLLELTVIVRILLRPHRDPASRIAWVVVVAVLPLWGMLAYLLLGEVNIGRRRVKRLHAISRADAGDPVVMKLEIQRTSEQTSPSVTGISFG